MSEQNKPMNSPATAADFPAKRKRGRPRKDENLLKKSNPIPGAIVDDGTARNHNLQINPSGSVDNQMIGQAVSGVIEGSFDAGYLLSVRIGQNGTPMRGVVFQPGHFTPITSANDIAPNAKMHRRIDFPFPCLDSKSEEKSTPQNQKSTALEEFHEKFHENRSDPPLEKLETDIESTKAESEPRVHQTIQEKNNIESGESVEDQTKTSGIDFEIDPVNQSGGGMKIDQNGLFGDEFSFPNTQTVAQAQGPIIESMEVVMERLFPHKNEILEASTMAAKKDEEASSNAADHAEPDSKSS